jgi:TonB family protein
VNIDFVKPAATAPGGLVVPAQVVTPFVPGRQFAIGGRGGSGGMIAPSPLSASTKLDHIDVVGLSDTARAQLLASLPVQEGSEWNGQTLVAVRDAANQFDSHLTVGVMRSTNGALTLRLAVPNSGSAPPAPADLPSGVYSVGNGTTAPSVLSKLDPVFPPGEPAGFAGSVMLSIVVGTDGRAEDIRIVKSLGADFDENAIRALEQWRFRPGMNHGVPVNVRAQVEVNFRKL